MNDVAQLFLLHIPIKTLHKVPELIIWSDDMNDEEELL